MRAIDGPLVSAQTSVPPFTKLYPRQRTVDGKLYRTALLWHDRPLAVRYTFADWVFDTSVTFF